MAIYNFSAAAYALNADVSSIFSPQSGTNAGVLIKSNGTEQFAEFLFQTNANSFVMFEPSGLVSDSEIIVTAYLNGESGIGSRYTATNNHLFSPKLNTANDQFRVEQNASGTVTVIVNETRNITNALGKYLIKARTVGNSLKIKIWPFATTEPVAWEFETSAVTLTTAGKCFFWSWGGPSSIQVTNVEVRTGDNISGTATVTPGIGQLTVQFEGVAINVADWHIITRLAADQSILYNQTAQSSDASGNIAAFATTSGSVGDPVRVEGLSVADAYSFVIEQNLGNIA
jgi:hypothetical protein